MAKRTITTVELTDDLDGGKADQTVTFAFQGVHYEIDLNKRNVAAMTKTLKPYVSAARKVRTTRARAASAARSVRRNDLADVRAWAKAHGHEVSDRGRVPAAVLDAYDGR